MTVPAGGSSVVLVAILFIITALDTGELLLVLHSRHPDWTLINPNSHPPPVSSTYQTLTTHSLRKTPNAQAKGQELVCYSCDSMEDGEQCLDLSGNNSNLFKKCKPDESFCTVKRISYTITTENATTPLRTWSLQRQCSNSCGKGCIVIGERTKLFACTSCCETSLCNVGEGRAVSMMGDSSTVRTVLILVAVFVQLSYYVS